MRDIDKVLADDIHCGYCEHSETCRKRNPQQNLAKTCSEFVHYLSNLKRDGREK